MMSSSKQKSGRTRFADQQSKKKGQSPGESRKLRFEAHNPLEGKSFYLDVRKQSAKLKKDLEDLGGVIETFLSKDVSYVVSDRPEVKLEYTKNVGFGVTSAASPSVSTPSPFQQSKDSAHGAADSPSTSGAREGMVTRGKAIVQKATISQTYGTSNVLANAHNWGVNIRYIDSVTKYINKEKKKMKDAGVKSPQVGSQHNQGKAATVKEKKLAKPSLKAEDVSRHYRPATQEMSSWPRLSMDGPSGTCPFDETIPTEKRTVDKRSIEGQQPRGKQCLAAKEVTHTALTQTYGARKQLSHTPSKHKDTGVKDTRRGYCECCLTKYADLEKHLASEQHQRFVHESNHYANLDIMIDEGPNMDQFLEDVLQNHEWQRLEGLRNMVIPDEVNLISSPSKQAHKSKEVSLQGCETGKQGEHDKVVDLPTTSLMSDSQPVLVTHCTDHQIVHTVSSAATNIQVSQSAPYDTALCCASHQEKQVPSTNSHHIQDGVCSVMTSHKPLADKSPPRRSGRHMSNNLITPSSTSKHDETSVQQHGEGNTPHSLYTIDLQQKEQGSKRSCIPNIDFTPKNPDRRSSRLSLSARRRQLQKIMLDSTEMTSPKEDTNVQVQVPANTPQTTDKRNKSQRLSLTARKRFLKESVIKKSLNVGAAQEASVRLDPDTSPGHKTTIDVEVGVRNDPKIWEHRTSVEQIQGPDKTNKSVQAADCKQRRKVRNKSDTSKTQSDRKRKAYSLHEGVPKKQSNYVGTSTHQKQIMHQNKKGRLVSNNDQTCEEVNVGDNQLMHCYSKENPPLGNCSTGHKARSDEKQPPTHTSTQCLQQANLEAIFYSDPNVVQSSFLGFSSEDITETEQRLQQLSASSLTYTNKLQEAALNVCCIPSSELCLPDQDEGSFSDSSDMSHMEEVVIGMALRNLANFPSDGSDWEAKVGGFMSVRLDEAMQKAMQIKKKETILLSQACIQGKENIQENQLRHSGSIPNKLSPVDLNRHLHVEQSPNTSQNILRKKEESISKKTEPKSKSDSEMPLTRQTLKTRSTRQTPQQIMSTGPENVHEETNTGQSPLSLNGPYNTLSLSSPHKYKKPVCSTPRHQKKSPNDDKYQIVFSPNIPVDDQEIILEHYVHDVSEKDIDFPKFSSPHPSDFIVSPIKNFTKNRSQNLKNRSGSPYKLKAPRVLTDLPLKGRSSKKSLFPRRRSSSSSMPGRVFHLHLNPPGSPRKREISPSMHLSPLKHCVTNLKQSLATQSGLDSLPQFSYMPINAHNKASPTFCAETKPNFSSHILHPGNKRRRSDRLRRHSYPQFVGDRTLQRPTRTWSMCVSFDDDICRSEDVYEFIDENTEEETGNSSQQSTSGNSVVKGHRKSAVKQNTGAGSPDQVCKPALQHSEHSDDQVMEDYGLPFSFFM